MVSRIASISNKKENHSLRLRYRGSLLGLAVGDALGTTLEFKAPGSFDRITDMVGGGHFGLDPGQWTDDTAMALCLAESLIDRKVFDPEDQMRRYLRWYREGYNSSTGTCFDIGVTIGAALRRFEVYQDPFAGETDPRSGGNGSLMRLAPIPLAFSSSPEDSILFAGEMSRTTHGASEPVDACRYYSGLIIGALTGISKNDLLQPRYSPLEDSWSQISLSPKIDEIAAGSFKKKQPPEIRGTGYVVQALEAALWAFWKTEDFETGALAAVNLGDDADTTGAIYGQLAGAYYGIDAIPDGWLSKLAMSERIIELADGLLDLSRRTKNMERDL